MIEVKPGIFWVGAIDWNVRNFHGYLTQRGTTYNSYLILDDLIALVDTVKESFFPEMMRRIEEVIDPGSIDLVVVNHIEPDHAGAIARLRRKIGNAEFIVSERGVEGLKRYHGGDLNLFTIKEKPSVSLGRRSLQFLATPMLHWPDSMITYIQEERLLLSNDAFGQHLATSERFDDEADLSVVMREAAKYYANIVMPYWKVVLRVLESLSNLEIEMIAPSHGVIWRKHPDRIVEAYRRWAEGASEERVVIVYDTMWGSTELIARAIEEGAVSEGVMVQAHRLSMSHYSDVVADILEAKAILVGSPALNATLFPTVAAFLAYLKGLRPRNKFAAAFGSYGWGGGAKKDAEEELRRAGFEVIESDLHFQFKPSTEELSKATAFGVEIARRVKKNSPTKG